MCGCVGGCTSIKNAVDTHDTSVNTIFLEKLYNSSIATYSHTQQGNNVQFIQQHKKEHENMCS